MKEKKIIKKNIEFSVMRWQFHQECMWTLWFQNQIQQWWALSWYKRQNFEGWLSFIISKCWDKIRGLIKLKAIKLAAKKLRFDVIEVTKSILYATSQGTCKFHWGTNYIKKKNTLAALWVVEHRSIRVHKDHRKDNSTCSMNSSENGTKRGQPNKNLIHKLRY